MKEGERFPARHDTYKTESRRGSKINVNKKTALKKKSRFKILSNRDSAAFSLLAAKLHV